MKLTLTIDLRAIAPVLQLLATAWARAARAWLALRTWGLLPLADYDHHLKAALRRADLEKSLCPPVRPTPARTAAVPLGRLATSPSRTHRGARRASACSGRRST
jgi:hypothetical protein